MEELLGLAYVDSVFNTIKASSFAAYTMTGVKSLGILLFLINIIRKYQEGAIRENGPTWGLHPQELIYNLMVALLVVFSDQILAYLDTILVSIEFQYRELAPDLLPLQIEDEQLEEEVGFVQAGTKALSLLYEYLVTPFYPMKVLAFVLGVFLWVLDLFIYPLFLAERFFILGLMQVFFPLIISLAMYDKFREMAYRFFKLYIGVYMLVPSFFLVNIFVNELNIQITENFWTIFTDTGDGGRFFKPVIQLASVGFIVLLKFKLYRKASSFTLRMFTGA